VPAGARARIAPFLLAPHSHVELKIERLSKTYPNGVHALRDVSLTIAPGMFGLLGPNGAGKSTLMRILATLQEADSGRVTLGEIDVLRDKEAVRRTLGYLPQEFGVYPRATAEELLDHFAVLKGVTDGRERHETVQSLLQQTNLWEARNRRLGSFSGGMRQRFGIAVALIGNPRLIIVDEPTAGLDPAERARFLNLLSELGENAVVILSTHIVEDVSDLCQRMAIIREGRILLEAEPQAAVDALRGEVWRREVPRDELEAFSRAHRVISTTLVGGRTVVHVHGHAAPDETFQPVQPDLKDVYFTVMGGIGIGGRQEEADGTGPVAWVPGQEDVAWDGGAGDAHDPAFFAQDAHGTTVDPAPRRYEPPPLPGDPQVLPAEPAPRLPTEPPPIPIPSRAPVDARPPTMEPPASTDAPPAAGPPADSPPEEDDPWALFRRPGAQ
jgi:ABC-2 type transport system ATP-binding protein